MCARSTAAYEYELCGLKDEKEPQLPDDPVFTLQPQIVQFKADLTEHVVWPKPEPPHIKEEQEEEEFPRVKDEEPQLSYMKKEEHDDYISVIQEEEEKAERAKFPLNGVHLKCEDESEEDGGLEIKSNSSSQHMKRESDGKDYRGKSQVDGPLAPLSDSDDTSHSLNADERSGVVREYLHPDWQQSVSGHIKEEEEGEELQCIKEKEEVFQHVKEEEQEEIIQVPSTGVHLNSEDGQSEMRREAAPPSLNSLSYGDHCEGSQTDVHNDDDEQSEGDMTCHNASKCWKCSQCQKTFASLTNFKQHMKIHIGEKTFACSVCGQRFTRSGSLIRHTRTHTGEKPFSCPVCDKRFTRKGGLKRHIRTHTGEQPFSCPVCDKRFTVKGKLKRHTRTHTGEKPFSCPVCDKRFSENGKLKVHTRTHTGEKPFACSVCDQRFTRKGTLKSHTITHTGDKPFPCSECGQRFSVKGNLKRHTRTHTSKKLLLAHFDQTFSSKYSNPSFFAVNGDQNTP
ncbi:zinc finger and SCAN domain-containing protein 2-like isoform X1 [Syngnathoides biaculeatus]|uniref:zinc finger and SCAN domain-containing protein 2-like isoform X1 n=1 Tax=Syngnathoides biaculeatus TaxID=300417 RepID=UPI002ADD62CB|nr:zinc finger and SCAN domain-containing protein 2-like isoform X1 [Syngnathoides biaculeatus]XP_061663201.1 zinc finger and SCAN domain-containing protein 2-like isoform X1 [Syngnathoides biaculeatus]XP_061663202.1 zinc finger and SCAN domain-containing protein 2-like isoform X1 [Syngnathoides biaculeatus]XP_061663203.1 zinc finger and SCAN domain-containing protein 2-like isoform X1 [Syngnathoides biaculeatus]